jgi:hypothetical protein
MLNWFSCCFGTHQPLQSFSISYSIKSQQTPAPPDEDDDEEHIAVAEFPADEAQRNYNADIVLNTEEKRDEHVAFNEEQEIFITLEDPTPKNFTCTLATPIASALQESKNTLCWMAGSTPLSFTMDFDCMTMASDYGLSHMAISHSHTI